ncbi:MAG: hypothetical protein IJU75_03950 [Clostridia bacterium]|nr:hypothetical protein [Clostridia bacterium]
MKYGLIGYPLGHSYSCELHGLLGNPEYSLNELLPRELDSFFESRDFYGLNVTIPYKKEVVKYLDNLSDEAEQIGAVNTVVNRDGVLSGYNTDAFGLEKLVRRVLPEGLHGKNVLILGTGGSSLTAKYVSKKLGAEKVLFLSRNPTGNGVIGVSDISDVCTDINLIINCTPVGMYPDETNDLPYGIDLSGFCNLSGVVDLIYNPLRTNLVLRAQEAGVRAEGGLFMLCAQAARAHELFFSLDPAPREDSLYASFLSSKRNVILIGMPSCGKSSVGRELSRLSRADLIDCDDEIEKYTGKRIRQIFEQDGEPAFREIEKKIISGLCISAGGKIIASGGGAVKDPENIRNFKKNGVVVFIDRSPEKLIATKDRPLSKDMDAVKRLYEERIDLYRSAADVTVDGNGTVSDTARNIIRILYPGV